MFWTLLGHHQGAHICIKQLLIILSDEGQKGLKHVELVLYIIVILIKVCALDGMNCNN
jgi:hypothetical protein